MRVMTFVEPSEKSAVAQPWRRVAVAALPAVALGGGSGIARLIAPPPMESVEAWLWSCALVGLALGIAFAATRGRRRFGWALYGAVAPLIVIGLFHVAFDLGHVGISRLANRKVDRCRAEKTQPICSYREFRAACESALHGQRAGSEEGRLSSQLGTPDRSCSTDGCRLRWSYAGPWEAEAWFPGPVTCVVKTSPREQALVERGYLVFPSRPD